MEHNVYIDSIPVPAGIKIKTTNGWAPLVSVNHTEPVDTTICIKTELGKELHCSKNHLLFVNENDTIEASKSLQHKVKTTDGYEYVTEIKNGSTEELYDVTVDDDRHEYQTNKIASHNCVCIDEGAFIPHLDDVLQAISPTLSRDPDAELIFTTTPGGMNGQFYEIYQTAKNDPNWYVQETTIYDAIADGLKIDLESLRTLCQDPEVFAQEYECKWMSEYGAMFDVGQLDWYEEAPKEAKTEYMSMDVGRTHDRSAIVIAKTYKDITYVDDIIMLNKTPYDEQLKIVKELHAKHHFQAGLIDAGGIGSALAEFVTKQVSVKITGIQFTATNKTSMFEALRAAVFDHKIKFNVKFKSLIESDFRNVQRVVNEVGSVKYIAGHNDQGHSDAATAIVLVIKAIHDNPLNVAVPVPYCNASTFGARRSIL